MSSMPSPGSPQNAGWWRTRTFQYALFGVLAGFLFPLVAIGLELLRRNFPVSLSNVLVVHDTEPPIWIIETAPLVLGFVAALVGWRQDLVLKANQTLRAQDAELRSMHSELEQMVGQRTAELDRRNAQMNSVIQFTRQISEYQDLPPLLENGVRIMADRFNWDRVDLYLLDQGGQSAVLRASSSHSADGAPMQPVRVAVTDQSPIGRAAGRGRPFVPAPRPGRQEPAAAGQPQHPSGLQIAIPLIARGRPIGALDVRLHSEQQVSQSDTEIYVLAAGQLATAIESMRLVGESRGAADQLKTVTTGTAHAEWRRYLSSREVAYRFTPSGISPIAAAPLDDQETLSVRLAVRGQNIGRIAVRRRADGGWTEADQELLEKVATQVALALENARLLDETRQRAAQEQVVSEISARLNRSLDVDAVLQSAAREFASLPDVAEATVMLSPGADTGDHRRSVG